MMSDGNEWSKEELEEMKRVFFAQAYETVDELQDAALRLEADPEDEETVKCLTRHLHTLKGDSCSIGFASIGTLCHRMEDVLRSLADGSPRAEHEAVDLLLSGIDTVHDLLVENESGEEGDGAEELIEKITRFLGNVNASDRSNGQAGSRLTEYQELQAAEARGSGLRVYDVDVGFHPQCGEKSVVALILRERLGGIGKIIRVLPGPEDGELSGASALAIVFASELDAETVKAAASLTGMTADITLVERRCETQREERQPATARPAAPVSGTRNELLRVETSRVDELMDLVGELIISRSMLAQAAQELEAGTSPGDAAARIVALNASLERTVSDLQKGVMKMRMVTVHHVFRKFPKMVRDLSAEKGKRVRLELIGRETELDKRIVDALGGPLAHLIRNMVDHGIETPEARRSGGKPEEGVITLKAYHEASRIVIEAGDDGKGIDGERLKQKAVAGGFLTQEEARSLPEADAVNLIFLSGLSTAGEVSEISGRGVGMDAVKTAVEGLKGSIEIETTRGKGTLFRLRLPLTLAVIKALLFEVGERTYAVPVPVIAEVARIRTDELVTIEGKETLLLRDRIISVITLEELFRVKGSGAGKKFVLILETGGRRVGLVIDRVLRQQELVIKALDDSHAQSDFVSGASILGNGKVVLILDAAAVFKKAVEEEKRKRRVAV